jgi:hypothetical protein
MNRFAYKEKTYLDQLPEFESIIRDYIDSLDTNYSDGYLTDEITPIECRSRDGFMPHGHNCGGFDKQWITDLHTVWGSGCSLGNYDSAAADKEYAEALEMFIKYDASDEMKALLQALPEDKQNYHDLYELGHGHIAEKLDEYCSDWLIGSYIYYGYRAMYEGCNNGWHTLMIYACANQSEYYDAFRGDTLAEIEIKFRNAAELNTKLEAVRGELESAF